MTDNSSISLSYKASCNKLIKAVQHAVDVRGIRKATNDSWDYYLPCSYKKCESDVLEFKNKKNWQENFYD